jgi:hypothetical protein
LRASELGGETKKRRQILTTPLDFRSYAGVGVQMQPIAARGLPALDHPQTSLDSFRLSERLASGLKNPCNELRIQSCFFDFSLNRD